MVRGNISKFVFRVCLMFNVIAWVFIGLGNVWYLGNNIFPNIGLTILLFDCLPLLISSCFVLWQDKKCWVLPVIGILLSLLTIAMIIGIAIALKNFT